MATKSIYLDYAASTPMDPAVFKAMEKFFINDFYNPSAAYLAARSVKKQVDSARSKIAGCLGAKPAEIVFTAGATEANNLAVQGVMRQFPDAEVLISAIEHDSVRTPAWLFDCREIPVNSDGRVNPSEVSELISDTTVLISIGLINNEIGTIQPIREVAKVIQTHCLRRQKAGNLRPLYLHTDAAQAPSYLDLNANRLGVDMLSINGGKIYGPKQSGVLFIKSGVQLAPIIGGGNQEWGMRAGTENVPSIIGLAEALVRAQNDRQAESQRLTAIREGFIKQLMQKFPKASVNGSVKYSAPHIISLTLPGTDNERLMMELDEAGIQCSTGSACHASSAEPSHVLRAIGMSDSNAHSTLRFSLGRDTTQKDLKYLIAKLTAMTAANR